jgi:hypothetical protein
VRCNTTAAWCLRGLWVTEKGSASGEKMVIDQLGVAEYRGVACGVGLGRRSSSFSYFHKRPLAAFLVACLRTPGEPFAVEEGVLQLVKLPQGRHALDDSRPALRTRPW